MARRFNINYKHYTEDGIRYMICQNSVEGGKWWKGVFCGNWPEVGLYTTAVLCSKCVNRVTELPKITPRYKPTGRPKGWHWMREFVDPDGIVYHKGVEQDDLKGTLPPTRIISKKKKRLSKRDRDIQKRTRMAELYDLKQQYNKAVFKKDKKAVESKINKLRKKIKIR